VHFLTCVTTSLSLRRGVLSRHSLGGAVRENISPRQLTGTCRGLESHLGLDLRGRNLATVFPCQLERISRDLERHRGLGGRRNLATVFPCQLARMSRDLERHRNLGGMEAEGGVKARFLPMMLIWVGQGARAALAAAGPKDC